MALELRASQAATQQACEGCGAYSLVVDEEDRLACTLCGTVMACTALDEAAEIEDNARAMMGRSMRRVAKSRKTERRDAQRRARARYEGERETPEGSIARLQSYARCLQALLQEEVQALITRFDVDPDAMGVARQLWLAWVARSRVLEPSFAEDAHARVGWLPDDAGATAPLPGGVAVGKRRGRARPEEEEEQQQRAEEEAGGGEGAPVTGIDAVARALADMLHARLRPAHVLALSFLSAFYVRAALLPAELVRGVFNGDVPFLNFRSISEKAQRGCRHPSHMTWICHPSMLTPPTPLALSHLAADMAASLQLPLPPVNSGGVLLRTARVLALPDGLAHVATMLVETHLGDSEHLRLHRQATQAPRSDAQPYAPLLAALLVAAKLCYGLGGGAALRRHPEGLPSAPRDWAAWAEGVVEGTLCAASGKGASSSAVAALPLKEFSEHINFCHNFLFDAHRPATGEISTVRSHLKALMDEKVQSAASQRGRSGGGAAAGQLPSCGRAAAGQLPNGGGAADGQLPSASGAAAGQPRDEGTPVHGHSGSKERKTASVMDAYALGHRHTATTPFEDAEYAAVLAAVASHAWLQPGLLHKLVCHLELLMLRAERALDAIDKAD